MLDSYLHNKDLGFSQQIESRCLVVSLVYPLPHRKVGSKIWGMIWGMVTKVGWRWGVSLSCENYPVSISYWMCKFHFSLAFKKIILYFFLLWFLFLWVSFCFLVFLFVFFFEKERKRERTQNYEVEWVGYISGISLRRGNMIKIHSIKN